MSSMPAVVVRKGTFLSAAAKGFFGVLATALVCGTVLGLFGLYIASDKVDAVTGLVGRVVEVLPEWQKALPPALADAINDRRDPSYRSELETTVRLLGQDRRDDRRQALITIANRGEQVVTLLALRLTGDDDRGAPTYERTVYGATPVAIEDDARGPLMPGQTRRVVVTIRSGSELESAALEVTELRVWNEKRRDDEVAAARDMDDDSDRH